MVEYSLCVCYGFIVDGKTMEKIEEYYDQNDDFEEFKDDYVRCVDAWTGGDYFIGLQNPILYDREMIRYIDDGIDTNFTPTDINNFCDLVAKYKIKEIIGDNPPLYRRMLINFCY